MTGHAGSRTLVPGRVALGPKVLAAELGRHEPRNGDSGIQGIGESQLLCLEQAAEDEPGEGWNSDECGY
jgi:hypothetical protein